MIYHKHWPYEVFDPFEGREAVEGTLQLSTDWAYWRHCFQDAAYPARWVIGARVRTHQVVPASGNEPARTHAIADPTVITEFITDDNATQVQVGQWQPGADPKALGEALASKEARLGQQLGVDSSDLVRTSGDPRSGYALAISQEAKRQAQVTYRPVFERADQELIGLTALVANRATGSDYPESGYQIRYGEAFAPAVDGKPEEQPDR